MSGLGNREVRPSVAAVLAEFLPNADLEYGVLADAIIERADIAAISMIDQREEALQRALTALMAYNTQVQTGLHDEITRLRKQVADLTLKLAKKESPDAT